MVAILDADKEGFLRSETSLIQTIGRSARNVNAEVYLYADEVTQSMQRAIEETERRRALQIAYNEEHNITPETIRKAIRRGIEDEIEARQIEREATGQSETQFVTQEYLSELEAEMLMAAENLEFERAASLRDRITELQQKLGEKITVHSEGEDSNEPKRRGGRKGRGKGRRSNSSSKRIPKPQRPDS